MSLLFSADNTKEEEINQIYTFIASRNVKEWVIQPKKKENTFKVYNIAFIYLTYSVRVQYALHCKDILGPIFIIMRIR